MELIRTGCPPNPASPIPVPGGDRGLARGESREEKEKREEQKSLAQSLTALTHHPRGVPLSPTSIITQRGTREWLEAAAGGALYSSALLPARASKPLPTGRHSTYTLAPHQSRSMCVSSSEPRAVCKGSSWLPPAPLDLASLSALRRSLSPYLSMSVFSC